VAINLPGTFLTIFLNPYYLLTKNKQHFINMIILKKFQEMLNNKIFVISIKSSISFLSSRENSCEYILIFFAFGAKKVDQECGNKFEPS
jgi:hypothetical protein